jgi:4-hydroxythreonine-4-phosphate dehydrogenase
MKARILITIGDINGIGPEIVLKALSRKELTRRYDITVITPVRVLEYYYRLLRLSAQMGYFKIIECGNIGVKTEPGRITKQSGYISGLAIETAIELCMKGRYDAIVTAPISKKALNLGNYHFEGHTEMLTELSHAKDTAMIMISDKIKVGFATTHPPLKNIAGLMTRKLLFSKIKTCCNSMKTDFGISNPRIGILSLNPHAGEGGQIGDEELKIISPLIKSLKKRISGCTFAGPYPSDSYFGNKTYNKFDMTFALYHDQGFIPFKMISGVKGVNFTAGLKFIRTSPDHGTAFDIAGKNLADETSIVEAIRIAGKIYKIRAAAK